MQFQLIQVFDQPEIGFKGNTSTVVFLENPLSEKQMQSIAADQLQPATTFLWKAKMKESIAFDGLHQMRKSGFVDMAPWPL